MNDLSDLNIYKEAIFSFLGQRLDKRLSDLEALRTRNNQTLGFIRKKIDLCSQQLDVTDIYTPPSDSENLCSQLTEFFKELREGRVPHQQQQLECVKGRPDDYEGDFDDVNNPSVDNTCDTSEDHIITEKQSPNDTVLIQNTQSDTKPPKGEHAANQSNPRSAALTRASSKAKLDGHAGEPVVKPMTRSFSRPNVRSAHQPEKMSKPNLDGAKTDNDTAEATIKPTKAINTNRTSTPGKIIGHQKKPSKVPANDEGNNILTSVAAESSIPKQVLSKKNDKSAFDSSKPVRPPRKTLNETKTAAKEDKGQKIVKAADDDHSQAKNTMDKEKKHSSPISNATAAGSNENTKKEADVRKTRSRTANKIAKDADLSKSKLNKEPQRESTTGSKSKKDTRLPKESEISQRASEKENNKIDASKTKAQGSETVDGKKLKPSASVKDIKAGSKKAKQQIKSEEGETPTFAGVKGTEFLDNQKSTCEKDSITKSLEKFIPFKAENGTFIDAHMLSFDAKEHDEENLLSDLEQIDDKNVNDGDCFEEETSATKRFTPIRERSNSCSPERKAKNLSVPSSSKKKNLELNVEEIEKESVEGWTNNPDTQQHRDEEDDFVNGGYFPKDVVTKNVNKIEEDNDDEKVTAHESPEKTGLEVHENVTDITDLSIDGIEGEADDVNETRGEANEDVNDDDANNSANAINMPEGSDEANEPVVEGICLESENLSPQKHATAEYNVAEGSAQQEGEKEAQADQSHENQDKVDTDDLDYEDVNGPSTS